MPPDDEERFRNCADREETLEKGNILVGRPQNAMSRFSRRSARITSSSSVADLQDGFRFPSILQADGGLS